MADVTADGGGRREVLDRLVHFLLPSPCLGCGAPLPAGRSPLSLCKACRARLRPAPVPACDGCGAPLDAAAVPAGYRCGACRARPPAFRRLVAPWSYAPPLDAVIRGLKFGRLDFLGEDLAATIFAAAVGELAGCDLVVPVPLHWRRRLARGYNQAERIARPLAAAEGLPVRHLLRRVKATPAQTGLGRSERLANPRGAFRTRGRRPLGGTHLLLVDDVMTSGATLEAAAACLKRAGAARVSAIVAGRTPETAGTAGPRQRPPRIAGNHGALDS